MGGSVNRSFHHWRPYTKEKLCFIKATSGLWPPGWEAPTVGLGTGQAGGSRHTLATEKGPFRGDGLSQGARGWPRALPGRPLLRTL